MKTATILFLCLAVCSLQAQVDAKHLAELQTVTHAHHLYYRVWCNENEDDPDKYFSAWAAYTNQTMALDDHFEGRGRGFWLEYGRTQEQAVVNLLVALRNPPDVPPLPKSAVKKSKDKMDHRQCPPEISGGPQ